MSGPWSASSGPRLSVRSGALELRQFGPEDTRTLFDIRNHATVRPFMPDPGELDYAAHCRWVESRLVAGSDYLIFLIRLGDVAIGFSLLKRLGPDDAEIGLMLREAHLHGTAAAQAAVLMAWLAVECCGVAEIVTYANAAHTRALALNRQFGLLEVPSDKAGELCFRTPAAVWQANPHYRRVMTRAGKRLVLTTLEPPA
jgi:RimJ/RimL family protein N-acetyltransferase